MHDVGREQRLDEARLELRKAKVAASRHQGLLDGQRHAAASALLRFESAEDRFAAAPDAHGAAARYELIRRNLVAALSDVERWAALVSVLEDQQ